MLHLTADGVIHVYLAGNNSARPSTSLGELRNDLRAMNSGKGIPSDVSRRGLARCAKGWSAIRAYFEATNHGYGHGWPILARPPSISTTACFLAIASIVIANREMQKPVASASSRFRSIRTLRSIGRLFGR